VCGSMQKAEQAAEELRSAARDERDPRTRSRALITVGTGYRLGGRTDDAVAIFNETVDLSFAHGFLTRMSVAILELVRLHLTSGDVPQARTCMNRLEFLAGADADSYNSNGRLFYLTRLALAEGNIEEASARYSSVVATSYPTSVNWRAAVLALGVMIAIQQKASTEVIRPIVADLRAAHLENRGSGGEDYEAHALAVGLRYCGDSDEALRLLSEYATTHRRERWALPENLSVLLREFRDNYAVSTTRRTGSLAISA
jgi:tetratricopeptide (TPR) repeat protein